MFGSKAESCESIQKSFVKIANLKDTHQFYTPLESISDFREYAEKLLCGGAKDCEARVRSLNSTDYVDLKYDAISQTLIVNSFWSRPEQPWQVMVQPAGAHRNIEVGVLGNDKPMGPESLTLGGVLHVVGKDDKMGT